MNLRERIEWLLRLSLLAFILASVAFLSAITAMRFAIHGREVEMPNLVGKSAGEAEAELTARGLGLRVADRGYSNLPPNAVVRQSPPAGLRVKVGQRAHVVLSLGRHDVKIPLVEGKSLRAARIELLRAGLQVGELTNLHLPEFAAEITVQQDPRPGGMVSSPRVNLLVSQGPREAAYVMPYLIGLNQVEAQRQVAAVGLQIGKLSLRPALEWPHGTVIEQVPTAGARVSASAPIELQVAE